MFKGKIEQELRDTMNRVLGIRADFGRSGTGIRE